MIAASVLELRHDYQANRLEWYDLATGQVVDGLTVQSTYCGCAIEKFGVSRSGKWIVTLRSSGQGEWGYDVICSHPLTRLAGVPEKIGYLLDLPEFAPDESYLLGGYGEHWLGGWWGHPDDDFYTTPARGGIIAFGWLFRHSLTSQQATFHRLRMRLPKGWFPDDPDDEMWYGARSITPLENGGVRLTLPGNIPFEYAGSLADCIDLPVPHPAGGRLM